MGPKDAFKQIIRLIEMLLEKQRVLFAFILHITLCYVIRMKNTEESIILNLGSVHVMVNHNHLVNLSVFQKKY